ncbi:4-hydroxy-3-methylbut-2-enyl diphosphate reductase [Chloroflexota bacterium]
MALKIEKAAGIGFCFGVRRAIDILEKAAREHGMVETLGAVVHNQSVLQGLAEIGVRIARDLDDIQGNIVAISSHGVSPKIEADLQARHIEVINTTCPFVRRAQVTARRLAKSGFFVIIYGDANHPEVKGILGWADDKGVATLDSESITHLWQHHHPRHLGILSQTTQIPTHFIEFAKKLVDYTMTKDSELRIIDTICHDIRYRQDAALKVANRVDLMLVIGGHTSANTNHLVELCSTVTKTYLVETADDIQTDWFHGHSCAGITAGASTAEQSINEVLTRLKTLA